MGAPPPTVRGITVLPLLAARLALLFWAAGALSLTVMEKVRAAVLLDASRTVTENVWLSTVVGRPEIKPVVLKLKPAGKVPE
ncbi:hypothetical protein AXXA_06278 [Achromobacter insuavis AXX-A]|uniref:Uncharacterized protein n=1 Tax=Achromobacter insuavis AXX-A TaxID=1003200 RepID=F7SX00_9BURK|nr:hypothetical protein AXXA_06278 [Achromobacter insuavis AXX-A]